MSTYLDYELWKQEKKVIFSTRLGAFFIKLMSLVGCQINPIDDNFHIQFFLEIFDENSAGKVWSKKDKG